MKTTFRAPIITDLETKRTYVPAVAIASGTTNGLLAEVGVFPLTEFMATVTAYDPTAGKFGGYKIAGFARNRPELSAKASQAFTPVTNLADGDTVTLGTKTYTVQATLTNVDGNVKLGADIATTLTNLAAAITLGTGVGTVYATAMTANTSATATTTATVLTATALTAGTAGNSITTTKSSTHAAWGASTMAGGVDTVSLIGSATITVYEDVGGWDANVIADVTNNLLQFRVTSDGTNATTFSAEIVTRNVTP